MGNAQKEKGDLDVAIDSYKKALKIQPDYAEAHNNMGNALTWIRDLDAAIYKYKHALKIRPDYAEANHFLACLSGKTTGVAPRAYVEKLFDDYASTFEYTLVDTLEYHTPKALTEMIVQNNSDGLLGSILDLGCGTGLGGLELKQFCQNLEGIDLSKMMIEKAKVKGVYDKLIHGEIV